MKNVMAVILAGGEGKRLFPLTTECTKPAIPFAGKWLIFDFVMNSIVNSEIDRTLVLTQYHAQPLIDHVDRFGFSSPLYGKSVRVVPAQQRSGKNWYEGTADAVYQNIRLLREDSNIDTATILAGDHIYKIDLRQMYEFHKRKKAVFSISAFAVSKEEAARKFGVIEVDEHFRAIGFQEKPEEPKEIPGKPGYCLASMGNYFADLEFLAEILAKDSADSQSMHDFGKNIIPAIIRAKSEIFAYDFAENKIPGEKGPYWRDVGTIQSYHAVHMDLVMPEPKLNLYNLQWPLRTLPDNLPPAKDVHIVLSRNKIASGGCVFDGSENPEIIMEMLEKKEFHIETSILGRSVYVGMNAQIRNSIIFDNAHIGAGARLKNTIIEKGVKIPGGDCIGCDHATDDERGFTIQDGITIVPRGFIF